MVEEPGVGDGDVEIGRKFVAATGDRVEGEAGDRAALAPEFFNLGGAEGAGGLPGVDGGAPENFVGHPVADAREAFLHEQDGFYRSTGATLQKRRYDLGAEGS